MRLLSNPNRQPDASALPAACMITKNEEKHLPRCLASLEKLTDRINIVDMGSTDRTIEIAKSFGARVISSPWRKDFAYHRNESLAMSRARFNNVAEHRSRRCSPTKSA